MMRPASWPGVPELMILRLLKDREMYGYEIVQTIAARTFQVVMPGEGVVYPVLHALEKEGALKSRRKTGERAQPRLLRSHRARRQKTRRAGRSLDLAQQCGAGGAACGLKACGRIC